MPWYPQDPVDRINHELKDRHDPQHQLRDRMYPRQLRTADLPPKSQIQVDHGQNYQEQHSLTDKQARLEEEFAVMPHATGFDKLMASQPQDFWINTPGPTMQEIRAHAAQSQWWDEPTAFMEPDYEPEY